MIKALLQNHKIFLLISALFILTRLSVLSGDPHLLDTSELFYQHSANQFYSLGWNSLKDPANLVYFSIYTLLAGFLQQILTGIGPLAGVRFLSLVGSYLIGLVLYFTSYKKDNKVFGIIGSTTFWLIPLAFYYSTKGIPLPFVLGLVMLSFYLQQSGMDQNKESHTISSAILMAAATLIQQEALVFLIGSALIHYYTKYNKHQTEVFLKTVIVGILVPITIYRIQMAKFGILSFRSDGFSALPFHYSQLGSLISVPVVIFAALGLLKFINYITSSQNLINLLIGKLTGSVKQTSRWQKYKSIFKKKVLKFQLDKKIELTFLYTAFILPLLIFAIFSDNIYTTLYAITPILAIFTALALSKLRHHVIIIVLLILIIPWTYTAWLNSSHNQLQRIAATLNELEKGYSQAKIYTTFQPEILEFYIDKNVEPFTGNESSYIEKQGEFYVIDSQSITQLSLQSPQAFSQLSNSLLEFEPYWTHWIDHDIYQYYPFNQEGNTVTVYRAINYEEHEFGTGSIFDRRDKTPENRFPFVY